MYRRPTYEEIRKEMHDRQIGVNEAKRYLDFGACYNAIGELDSKSDTFDTDLKDILHYLLKHSN